MPPEVKVCNATGCAYNDGDGMCELDSDEVELDSFGSCLDFENTAK